jgi:hypothetical protein
MELSYIKGAMLVAAGFTIGVLTWNLPYARADESRRDPSTMHFVVSIDEVKTNFAYGKPFRDHFADTVTLSDGSTRTIELTPMFHDGAQSVELKDNGTASYSGLNSTFRNGSLVVQVRNQESARDELYAEGWRDSDKTKSQ